MWSPTATALLALVVICALTQPSIAQNTTAIPAGVNTSAPAVSNASTTAAPTTNNTNASTPAPTKVPLPPTPPTNGTNATNATKLSNRTKTPTISLPSRSQIPTQSVSQSLTWRRLNGTNSTGNATKNNSTGNETRYSVTKTLQLPPPTTQAPALDGDDVSNPNAGFYVAMILSIANNDFYDYIDTFAARIIAPALIDKSYERRVLLREWCGISTTAIATNWAATNCFGMAEDVLDGVLVKWTFANTRNQSFFDDMNVDRSRIPNLVMNPTTGAGYYSILPLVTPTGTPSPGLVGTAAANAGSPLGIIIIIIMVILIAVVIYFVVKRLYRRSGPQGGTAARQARYEGGDDGVPPPAPGTEFEMAGPRATAGPSVPTQYNPDGAYNQGGAYNGGGGYNGGTPPPQQQYNASAAPPPQQMYQPPPAQKQPSPQPQPSTADAPSHQTRDMDLDY